MPYTKYEEMYFQEDTGEALLLFPAPETSDEGPAFLRMRVRQSTILAPTGWFFERGMTQMLADVANLDGERVSTGVAPWNFLSNASAQRLAAMFANIFQVPIDVVEGENNPQFPYSKKPLMIRFRANGQEFKVNAGQVATRICHAMTWVEPMGPPFHNSQAIDTILRDAIAGATSK